MTYGFNIKNADGKEIIYGTEEAYLFWGKLAYTEWMGLYPAMPNKYYDLGFPYSRNALMYVAIDFGGWTGQIMVGLTKAGNGNAQVEIRGYHQSNASNALTIRCYVFVPAKYIALPNYGLALYNDAGTVAFHNGAKVMNVAGIKYYNYKYWASDPVIPMPDYSKYAVQGNLATAIKVHNTSKTKTILCLSATRSPYIKFSEYD